MLLRWKIKLPANLGSEVKSQMTRGYSDLWSSRAGENIKKGLPYALNLDLEVNRQQLNIYIHT